MGVSLGLAATLVFAVWYPYPYREISGGRSLFEMVVAIDVVMGPLLTLDRLHPKTGPLPLWVIFP